MKLSQTSRQNKYDVTWGFTPIDVNPRSVDQLLGVLKCDWSPFLFKGNNRLGENFISCECLLMDIDNTDGEKCSIDSFETIFRDTNYILSTSRNHQKEKMYGKGKSLISPPQDRFHVLFPLSKAITTPDKVCASLHALISKYPFFDKSVSGPAQLVFANPNTIIFIHEGEEIEIPKIEIPKIEIQKTEYKAQQEIPWPKDSNEKDFLESPANRIKLLKALQNTAAEGGFDSRNDWIKIGMALKVGGFTAQDFASISWDEAIDDALKTFETLDPKSVTAGTLFYYAKMSTKLSFISEEEERLAFEGDQIFRGWKKNEQEEKTKLLAERMPEAKAGPAPDNFMPESGVIKEIAEYILDSYSGSCFACQCFNWKKIRVAYTARIKYLFCWACRIGKRERTCPKDN
jgi:hypothetical protein